MKNKQKQQQQQRHKNIKHTERRSERYLQIER